MQCCSTLQQKVVFYKGRPGEVIMNVVRSVSETTGSALAID